jgi:hypothetical protein
MEEIQLVANYVNVHSPGYIIENLSKKDKAIDLILVILITGDKLLSDSSLYML